MKFNVFLGWRILFHLFIFLSLFPPHQFFQIATLKEQILAEEAQTKSVADAQLSWKVIRIQTTFRGREWKKGGRRDQGKKVYVQKLQNRKQTKSFQTGKKHRWLQIALWKKNNVKIDNFILQFNYTSIRLWWECTREHVNGMRSSFSNSKT